MAAYRMITVGLMLFSAVAAAEQLPPPAYQLAAQQAGIPSQILFAVALQESGTQLRGQVMPWPWTLNVAGEPARFADRQSACRALQHAMLEHDRKRIDVGLGQTNLGHNGERYASACAALDPRRNLAVTAALLREHYDATGNWLEAIGRYHRPAGGVLAARYRASVQRQLNRLNASPYLAQETSP